MSKGGYFPVPHYLFDALMTCATTPAKNQKAATMLLILSRVCSRNGFDDLEIGQIRVSESDVANVVKCSKGQAHKLLSKVMTEWNMMRVKDGVLVIPDWENARKTLGNSRKEDWKEDWKPSESEGAIEPQGYSSDTEAVLEGLVEGAVEGEIASKANDDAGLEAPQEYKNTRLQSTTTLQPAVAERPKRKKKSEHDIDFTPTFLEAWDIWSRLFRLMEKDCKDRFDKVFSAKSPGSKAGALKCWESRLKTRIGGKPVTEAALLESIRESANAKYAEAASGKAYVYRMMTSEINGDAFSDLLTDVMERLNANPN